MLSILFLFLACAPDTKLQGALAKGPFILGSSVAVSALDAVGSPTGEVYNTQTDSDLGSFSLSFAYTGLFGIEGTGFYWNEVTGVLSTAPITLRAIDEVSGGPTHTYVNLVTHLSMGRVITLLGSGSAYADAADQAERELRTALGIGPDGFDPGARGGDMNVYGGDNDANAYLLAVSAVFAQAAHADGNKGAPVDATLQEMVNHIAADLSGNDPIGKQDAAALRDAEAALDPEAVMTALEGRLASLGSSEVVPDMNRVIDSDLDGLANNDDPDRDGDGHDGQAWGGDDCDDIDPTTLADYTYFADADGDGYGDSGAAVGDCVPEPPKGYVTNGTDCDDTDATVFTNLIYYPDADGDGYGDPGAPVNSCVLPKGYVTDSSDCDDTRADVRFPTWYRDADEDGYGDPNNTVVDGCNPPTGYLADGTDCDDSVSWVHPGVDEYCNDVDDNCDGSIDGPDALDVRLEYPDLDGDSYGDGRAGVIQCHVNNCQGICYTWDRSDCDDTNAASYPGAPEICDGQDNDCDRVVDNDHDGDGFAACDDCDEAHAINHPGATEVCDGADNDCSGAADDVDADGDGWLICDDCDEADPAVNPDASEICGNRKDDDCDGATGCGGLEAEVTADAEFMAILIGGEGDQAGFSLAGVGDVNGDGYEDVLVGGPTHEESPHFSPGTSYLVHGPLSGSVSLSTWVPARWTGIADLDFSGCAVDGGGDLDGDGNADFVIGASDENSGALGAGAVYVSYGPALGDSSLADAEAVIYGEQVDNHLGQILTLVGDTDRDGLDDLLLGSPGTGSTSGSGPGAAYLFLGPVSGSYGAADADVVLTDASAVGTEEVGSTVTDLGDVDGDGLGDILVGAGGFDSAMLVLGPVQSTTAIFTENDAIITGPNLPFSAVGPGDTDGDGFDDIWLGTYQTGTAYLLSGAIRGTVSATTDYMAEVTSTDLSVGNSVGGAGDVDGDGFADLLVDQDTYMSSRALLFYGPLTGSHPPEEADGLIEPYYPVGDITDHADINGDGFSDLLFGSIDRGLSGPPLGGVYILAGGPGL